MSEKKIQKYLINLQRRRFLKQSAAGMTGATLALAGGKNSWYAWAEAQQARPSLINIHLPAGWDTNWFHMAFPKRFISEAADNPNLIPGHVAGSYDDAFTKPPGAGAAGSDPFGRKLDVDTNSAITQYYHDRYSERTLSDRLTPHPTRGAPVATAVAGQHHFFGAGAALAFANTSRGLAHFDKTCIWKGIYSGGAHGIPNRNIIHGSESQYAISFSGLIAEALAARHGKLQLNYMQLTGSPTEYGANWAMSKGDQVPINCADHASLINLTRRGTHDFQQSGPYGAVNDAVKRLGGQLAKEKFSLSKSRSIYDEFMRFFKGALDISELGTNMGGFLAIWQNYANYTLNRVRAMHDPDWVKNNISPEVVLPFRNAAYNYHLYAPYIGSFTPLVKPKDPANSSADLATPLAEDPAKKQMYEYEIGQIVGSLGADFAATEASLNIAGGSLRGDIAKAAWKFALAEYLIVNGYSSVVDLVFNTGDAHGDNQREFRFLVMIYSLYARLVERLEGAGRLDRTLVNVFSEFDRTANLGTDVSTENRGTGHDLTESILLTGFGVKQGTVYGDRRYGANGGPAQVTYTVMDSEGKTETKVFAPTSFTYMYVFPTIMKIFNVPVPANQITDASAVLDVIK